MDYRRNLNFVKNYYVRSAFIVEKKN